MTELGEVLLTLCPKSYVFSVVKNGIGIGSYVFLLYDLECELKTKMAAWTFILKMTSSIFVTHFT